MVEGGTGDQLANICKKFEHHLLHACAYGKEGKKAKSEGTMRRESGKLRTTRDVQGVPHLEPILYKTFGRSVQTKYFPPMYELISFTTYLLFKQFPRQLRSPQSGHHSNVLRSGKMHRGRYAALLRDCFARLWART